MVQSLLNRAAVSTVRRGGNEEVAGEAAASSAATVNKKQPLNNVKRDMQQQLPQRQDDEPFRTGRIAARGVCDAVLR